MSTVEAPRHARGPYRHLWWVFILLLPAAGLAFVKSYFDGYTFSRLPVTTFVHLHVATMMLWLLMLVGQAWFIHTRRYKIHRFVGRSSFIIVPLIVTLTLLTGHESLVRKPEIASIHARFEIFTWLQTIPFAVVWALGILYRRKTPIHVRYMVSTAFTMGSAITFRILLSWFDWAPGLGMASIAEIEATSIVNGAVLVLPLLVLIAFDWRKGIKRSPFWLVVITTLIMHIGFLTFTKSAWWMSFVEWYAAL